MSAHVGDESRREICVGSRLWIFVNSVENIVADDPKAIALRCLHFSDDTDVHRDWNSSPDGVSVAGAISLAAVVGEPHPPHSGRNSR